MIPSSNPVPNITILVNGILNPQLISRDVTHRAISLLNVVPSAMPQDSQLSLSCVEFSLFLGEDWGERAYYITISSGLPKKQAHCASQFSFNSYSYVFFKPCSNSLLL